MIIREHAIRVQMGLGVRKRDPDMDVLEVDIEAKMFAIQRAVEMGFEKVILEFGSAKMVNLHNGSTFPLNYAENLVELNLAYSNVRQLWTGVQSLEKLGDLNMRYCTSLETFPSVINLRSLKTLNFSDCSNLMKCPETAKNIVYLNLKGTAIEELPKSTGHLSDLITLDLKDCKRISNLLESICLLKSLVTINLSGCPDITRIPNISGKVRFLYLSETAIEEIPSSIGSLSRLSCLDLTNCKRLKNLPCDVSRLASFEKVILSGCTRITRFPEVSSNIKNCF
ncbi:hypothetical protein GH714_016684 [Hevea brasiliensis]|uniref:Uncharacterized protein n=1 Tax=Hevea brasiliensis TaxID=3981 RepID=A0A6A6L7W4_HEVBR|nr:hypothetical protein GH714_016684 [Hevea brasiliensis]